MARQPKEKPAKQAGKDPVEQAGKEKQASFRPEAVRFRSRFPKYRFQTLCFEGHIAKTADKSIIDAAKRDPSFGSDFWIEPAEAVDAAVANTQHSSTQSSKRPGG